MKRTDAPRIIVAKSATDLFSSLAGTWKLTRTIHPQGRFDGTARFEPTEPNTLFYREEGLLSLPGAIESSANREYLYRLENDHICVYFVENPPRLFHSLELKSQTPEAAITAAAKHVCIADEYVSDYLFRRDGTFRIRHKVNGPRKHYVLDSEYQRYSH
jgi:hypothetical protein